MIMNYRVNLGFAGYRDSELGDFTGSIIIGLTGNAAFPAPPVSVADLTTQQAAYATALNNTALGGPQQTALKNAAKLVVIDSLRKNAAYVQSLANQDVGMLLSSGYQANSTNRARVQLDVPAITEILNEMNTTLTVRLQPVDNARSYQVRYCVNGAAWLPVIDSTQARRIVLPDLTPGTIYTAQSRAVGGATGYSNWSDPVSHMAM
jgi:hypothetical protein